MTLKQAIITIDKKKLELSKSELLALLSTQIDNMLTQVRNELLGAVSAQIRAIPRPVRGEKGEKGDIGIGLAGKDGSPDGGKEIVSKVNSLPIKPELQIDARHIKNLPKSTPLFSKLGRGTGHPAQIADLSSSLNGSTKVFSLPVNRRVIAVLGSSAPFWFRPTIDFIISGTNNTILTFDASIDAGISLAGGQSLGVIYTES